MILFHGSNVAVEKPVILTDGYTKDFGFGFYCTSLDQQAKKWALSKKRAHVVSIFECEDKFDGLAVKRFPQMVFCTDRALGLLKFIKSEEL